MDGVNGVNGSLRAPPRLRTPRALMFGCTASVSLSRRCRHRVLYPRSSSGLVGHRSCRRRGAIRSVRVIRSIRCATKLQERRWDVRESLKCAVLEMRAGPSDSECRLGVQTADCCVGSMTGVVNEIGKGGLTVRQVSGEETNASEPLITCRKTLAVIKTG